jgi:hypothetical protein
MKKQKESLLKEQVTLSAPCNLSNCTSSGFSSTVLICSPTSSVKGKNSGWGSSADRATLQLIHSPR